MTDDSNGLELKTWLPWSGLLIRLRRGALRVPPVFATVLCVALVLGAEQLCERISDQSDLEQERHTARELLAVTRARLEGVINTNFYLVHGLAALVSAHPEIDQPEFARIAQGVVDGRHALRSIAGAPNMVVRLVYPFEANRGALGLDFRTNPAQRDMALQAMQSGEASLAGPLALVQGGAGLIIREPVFLPATSEDAQIPFWGLISAVIDTDRLYQLAGIGDRYQPGWELAIRGRDGKGKQGDIFFGNAQLFDRAPVLSEVVFPGGSWQLAVVPTIGWGHTGASERAMIRLLGVLAAALLGFMAHRTARRGQMLAVTLARLQSLVDTIPDMVWVKGQDGRYLSCNSHFEALVGAMPKTVPGKTDADFFPPEQVAFFAANDQLAASSEERVCTESWVVRASDQRRMLLETIKSPVRDTDGSVLGVLGIARDITQRKQAEDQIRDLNRVYALLSGINQSLVRSHEPDTLYKDACRIAVEAGGFRMAWLGVPDTTTGLVKILASAGSGQGYLDTLQLSLGDDASGSGPTGMALKLGHHVVSNDIATDPSMRHWREAALDHGFCALVGLPILVGGQLHGVFALYADRPGFFTPKELHLLDELALNIGFSLEFMQAEHKVREQRDLLDRTNHLAQVGGWFFDTATMHSIWTSETARIFELDLQDDLTVSMAVHDALLFFKDEAHAALAHAIDLAVHEARPFDLELEITSAKGSRKWIRCLGLPVVDAGKVVRVDGASQDITVAKRMEQEIRQLNSGLEQRVEARTQELAAANKELETFTYLVSHDLKAPLRGIDGYSRLLLEDHLAQLNAEGQLFARNIRTGVEQMGQLIEDLLSYSRAERRPFVDTPLDLAQQIHSILANWTAELNRSRIAVDIDLECKEVRADPEGMKMVIGNLLDNAIKFSGRSETPRIAIRSRQTGNGSVLSIQDNGIGFDMQFQDRIFDIFQRLQRAEDFPGTGVGLAIVRKAMQRMGGRVWAESAPGHGATFFLEFPR